MPSSSTIQRRFSLSTSAYSTAQLSSRHHVLQCLSFHCMTNKLFFKVAHNVQLSSACFSRLLLVTRMPRPFSICGLAKGVQKALGYERTGFLKGLWHPIRKFVLIDNYGLGGNGSIKSRRFISWLREFTNLCMFWGSSRYFFGHEILFFLLFFLRYHPLLLLQRPIPFPPLYFQFHLAFRPISSSLVFLVCRPQIITQIITHKLEPLFFRFYSNNHS